MRVRELITHLYQLPQDAEIRMVTNQASGKDAPLKDILYEQRLHAVVFDSMPSLTAGVMHYETNRMLMP